MKRTITITVDGGKMNVIEDGRETGPLTWDEMLGHVAAMTISRDRVRPDGLYTMRTKKEWEDYERRMHIGRTVEEPNAEQKETQPT